VKAFAERPAREVVRAPVKTHVKVAVILLVRVPVKILVEAARPGS
jgi:hypothetical protein